MATSGAVTRVKVLPSKTASVSTGTDSEPRGTWTRPITDVMAALGGLAGARAAARVAERLAAGERAAGDAQAAQFLGAEDRGAEEIRPCRCLPGPLSAVSLAPEARR